MYFDKLTKNLVITVSSLWTRYSIKNLYVNVRTDMAPPSLLAYVLILTDSLPSPPNCGRNK